MDIKELIKHLRCFDEEHHVVIKYEDDCRDIEQEITEVKFDGRNCVIQVEY